MPKKPTYEELEQRVRELESVESQYKRMLEEQQQKEKRYQNLFENMLHEVHVWQLVYDDDGNIITWKLVDANPAALKSWKKNLSEIVGRTTDEIFPNSNPTELFMPIVKKIFTEGAPHIWESYVPDTNQLLHMISVPFGECFISTGTDITDRKRIEEALRESLEKYRVLFESFPLGITISDKAGRILETNREAERLLGISPSEHTRRQIDGEEWRIIRTDGTPMPAVEYASVRALQEQRIIENAEMGIVNGSGEVAWISVTAAPIPLEGYGVAVTYGDITDRKQTEDALKESEERFRLIAESSVEILYQLDLNGKITFMSPAFERIYGYPLEEVVNLDYRAFFPESELGKVRNLINNALAGEKYQLCEFLATRKDNSIFPIEISITPIIKNGEIVSVQGITRDISERKQLELEKDHLIDELQQALAKVKKLEGFLPICSYCKKIRDDLGYWQQIEKYIHDRSEAQFSHSICPRCAKEHFPDMDLYDK